ncbi:MAG: hypothetical protein V1760_00455 [Candidatus Peregrinibacteria bacterium]
MPYHFPNNTIDPKQFIEDLMEKMNLQNADETKKGALKTAIENQMVEAILSAASLHLEEDEIQEIQNQYPGETDLAYLIRKLIEASPNAQVAILATLDSLYDQTLDACAYLTK